MARGADTPPGGASNAARELDKKEQDQAAQHSAPPAVVIHEIVKKDGEEELRRMPGAILWSGLAAGLSMGFSFLTLALDPERAAGRAVALPHRQLRL